MWGAGRVWAGMGESSGPSASSSSVSISSARAVVCGNAKREPPETCDDGNTRAGDGCSATCTVEDGFVCRIGDGSSQSSGPSSTVSSLRSAASTLTNGLVAHWTFDTGTIQGNTVQDVTGLGHDFTNNGVTMTNGCADFNGTSSYLHTANPNLLPSGKSPRVISFWIKTRKYNNFAFPFSLGTGEIRDNGRDDTKESPRYLLGPATMSNASGQRLRDLIFSGGEVNQPEEIEVNYHSNEPYPITNEWHHVLFQSDESIEGGAWVYYLDGKLLRGGSAIGSPHAFGDPISDGVELGGLLHYFYPRGQEQNFFFDGKMDDVRIYNRLFYASEIDELQQIRPTCASQAATPNPDGEEIAQTEPPRLSLWSRFLAFFGVGRIDSGTLTAQVGGQGGSDLIIGPGSGISQEIRRAHV